jgi:hypothetical protein
MIISCNKPYICPCCFYRNNLFTVIIFNSRVNSAGIAGGYWLDCLGSMPGWKDFSLLAHPAFYPVLQRVDFPGGKAPGSELYHSPPSSVEVENGENIPIFPPHIFRHSA